METWKEAWNSLINSSEAKEEYHRSFLLNMFKKICIKTEKNAEYRKRINALLRQSYNLEETVGIIVQKEFNYLLDDDEITLFLAWVNAYRRKRPYRKNIPLTTKKILYGIQNGLCNSCGEPLGDDWQKIHVDHIIPWVLVGDELEDNLQDLCETCNKCKNAKTDYIFKKMIKLS